MDSLVVLITGCSTGIGRALVQEFHGRGHSVTATARRLETLEDLKSRGVHVDRLDVTNSEDIERVVSGVLEREKTIDVLVNNAGFGLVGPAIEIPEAELQSQFQTNVFGALSLIKRVAPPMKTQGSGLIINIGSISGVVTTPFAGAYCASKAALHALSDALRMELSPFGINVVTVQPGGVRSRFGRSSKEALARVLTSESWYHPIEEKIKSRAEISQLDATPAELFSRKLLDAVLSSSPPAIVRIGRMSFLLPLLKQLIPGRYLDAFLKDKFGLSSLAAKK